MARTRATGERAGGAERRADVGYYASRAMLGRLANEASSLLLERGATNFAAPAVTALTGEVASRFGVVVWEKIAASAIPLAGAAGAATINVVFMTTFSRSRADISCCGGWSASMAKRRFGAIIGG